MELKIIGRVYSDFDEKFGIPRQSGIINDLKSKIIFEPGYRNAEAVRGLSEFSHIWIIWQFSESLRDDWSPTVRPPRLGGNKRVGVFATRSPFRPNEIGLSSVKLDKIEFTEGLGPVLHISGADMLNGTPVFDIKPYLPFTDSHKDATAGFAEETKDYKIEVEAPGELLEIIPEEKRDALIKIMENDPRPSYKKVEIREYGFQFAGYEIKFKAEGKKLILTKIQKKI